jgi:hypothetical protein
LLWLHLDLAAPGTKKAHKSRVCRVWRLVFHKMTVQACCAQVCKLLQSKPSGQNSSCLLYLHGQSF